MKILGIDTTSKYLGLAVIEDEVILSEYTVDTNMRHASLLIPYIDRVLKDLNLSLEQIDGLSLSLGPGSFTGLRIGLATVKGLALPADKPVVGVPTLDVIACNFTNISSRVCVILDAKKNQLYWAVYKPVSKAPAADAGRDLPRQESCRFSLENETGYNLSPVETLLGKIRVKTIFTGDGIDVFGREILRRKKGKAVFASKAHWYPRASIVARLGLARFNAGQSDQADTLEPMYLYAGDCTVSRRGKSTEWNPALR